MRLQAGAPRPPPPRFPLQKDPALFPGPDPQEFWQRARDRNRATTALYDRRAPCGCGAAGPLAACCPQAGERATCSYASRRSDGQVVAVLC